MAVYVIASYDITDPKGYEPYVPQVVPLLQKHGAEVLVADYAAQPLEGQARGVNVILRFENEEAAKRWYNDPAYEPVKRIRLGSTANASLLLAKGFVPPAA